MFENFRKNVANTAKELPKEERKDFLENAQQSETYIKAQQEHMINNGVGVNRVEIGGKILELGPHLGRMSWDDIQSKLEGINKTLKSGEKPWRVPSEEEFKEMGKPISEIWNDKSLPKDQKMSKVAEIVHSLGFNGVGADYWSSKGDDNERGFAWFWSPMYGDVNGCYKSVENLVRVIR